MDELIGRLVANVGVDRDAAEKSVGIIFEFLLKEGPADKVQALLDRLPGAQEFMQAQEGLDSSGGGMFALGGLMGAGTKMMSAGLRLTNITGEGPGAAGFGGIALRTAAKFASAGTAANAGGNFDTGWYGPP